eukprot:COSAG02_NODE_3101_length_7374_cov_9.069828_4_plen_79_part_00
MEWWTEQAITHLKIGLCTNFFRRSSVWARDASGKVSHGAHRPDTEFPPLFSGPRSGHVLGEGGVNQGYIIFPLTHPTK